MKVFSLEFGMQLCCFKGGSGSGGGGSSGAIDFPTYMKDWHEDALGGGAFPTDMRDVMNAAIGSSPFIGENTYDPDADITAYEAAIAGFGAIIAGINEPVDWAALYNQAVATIDGVSDVDITADVAAFAAEQDDQLLAVVLPRFESGMRDIGAVVSSAFAIGSSNIEGFRDRDVARHSSKLRLAVVADKERLYLEGTSQMMQFLHARYGWEEAYMRTIIEGRRIKIIAKKEEADTNLKIDESDALWDLKVFKFGGNLLSSISGSAVSEEAEVNILPSVIGGALSGAAAGAMVGSVVPGLGTVTGAIIGGVLGAGAGFL